MFLAFQTYYNLILVLELLKNTDTISTDEFRIFSFQHYCFISSVRKHIKRKSIGNITVPKLSVIFSSKIQKLLSLKDITILMNSLEVSNIQMTMLFV